MLFRHVLRDRIKYMGMSVAEFADTNGIGRRTIQRYLNGESLPPIGKLPGICDALGFRLTRWEIEHQSFDISTGVSQRARMYRAYYRQLDGARGTSET